jgi:hypothetical protein
MVTFADELIANLALPTAWERVGSLFKHKHRNKSACWLLLGGPLGVYMLQVCDFECTKGNDVLKPLLMDFLLCLELVQARVHTTSTLDELHATLVRVMAELETLLPIFWNSNVRHVMLHVCDFIKRAGPFHSQSMLTFERYHTVLKKLAAATKPSALMASIRNRFNYLFSASLWSCPSQSENYGQSASGRRIRSTITSRVNHEWGKMTFTLRERGSRQSQLDDSNGGAFNQVQDQWAVLLPSYDRLRDRYRQDMRNRRRSLRRHFTTCVMHDPDWSPARGQPLTSREKLYMKMSRWVTDYDCVEVQNIRFSTSSYQRELRTDDTGIKTWFLDEDNDEQVAYGTIQRIFTHQAYDRGRKEVMLEVEWFDIVESDLHLPTVQKNPESVANVRQRYVPLSKCANYNILFLPADPWAESNSLFCVIDRWRTYQDHAEHVWF